jgi:tetratricopeptide (TPR) repeat protein
MRLGGDNEELAESTLRIVLEESEVFAPAAPEFSEALFLLGDVQLRRGKFEPAIGTLREVLERYPADWRSLRARFLLAEANRRSGMAIQKEAMNDRSGAIEELRAEYELRFMAARQGFRRVIDELEARPPHALIALEDLYLRHAYVYEADCLFEVQAYEPALKLYEYATAVLREHPTGLAAYVRVIHCHVFLGRPREARAALSRALVMVDSIPDVVFEQSVSPEGRADWKRYFRWLDSAGLF